MTEPAPVKRRRGCLFYGCLVGLVCLVAILIAFLLGLHMFKRMLNEFTDTEPTVLPAVQMPQAQFDQLQQRIDQFSSAVASGKPTPPLELTSDELNALLASHPKAEAWKGKLYVTLKGDQATAQFSLPLAQLGMRLFSGRYLNGAGTLAVWLQDGALQIKAQSLSVKGKPLPGIYMNRIAAQNLAANLGYNQSLATALTRLQDAHVKDGKLVLVPKPPQ